MRDTTKRLSLRLNAIEYGHLKSLSKTTGLKMEPLLRKLVLEETLCPRPPDVYVALLRELSAIGNNINQIAHVANGKGNIHTDEMKESIRLTRQAWQLVKDAF